VCVIFAVLTAGATGCSERRAPGNVVILGTTNSATNLDPRVGTDEASQKIHQLIFDNLMELDDHMRVTPKLAERLDHPTPTTYVVTLRQGVRFHDGHELTSADVVYTFRSFLDPDFVSGRKGGYRELHAVDATGPYTVVFTLDKPFTSFPINLVMPIVPDRAAGSLSIKPVGTGPYKLISAVKDDKIVFEANQAYNGPMPALAKGMTWLLLSDAAARVTAMQSGRVQAIEDVPYLDMQGLKSAATVESVQSFGLLFMMFNCNAAPFNNKKVRQALHYGLDKEAIIKKALFGNAKAATSYFQEGHPDYVKAKNVYGYDAQKAADLLKEAGVTNLEFELLTTDTAWVKDVAPLMLESWNKIPGVKVTLKNLQSGALYTDRVAKGDYTVVAAPGDPSVFGNDADLLLSWFYAGDTWMKNRAFWGATPERAQLVDLMSKAGQATKEDAKKLTGQIVDLVSEEVPLYPLFHRQLPSAWDAKKLSGFKPLPTTGVSFVGVGRTA